MNQGSAFPAAEGGKRWGRGKASPLSHFHLMVDRQGQLSCALSFRARSPVPLPLGPILLCCPDKVQGPLSPVLWPLRGRDSSLALKTLWPTLPTATCEGRGWEGITYTPTTSQQRHIRACTPVFSLSGPAQPCSHQQGQLCSAVQARYRAHSPGCCSQ